MTTGELHPSRGDNSYHSIMHHNFIHIEPKTQYDLEGIQSRAHACIFGWLLGDCISETTADIYSKKRKTYATRLAKAIHIANYER